LISKTRIVIFIEDFSKSGGVEKIFFLLYNELINNNNYEVLAFSFFNQQNLYNNEIIVTSNLLKIRREVKNFNPHYIKSFDFSAIIVSFLMGFKSKKIYSHHLPLQFINRKQNLLGFYFPMFLFKVIQKHFGSVIVYNSRSELSFNFNQKSIYIGNPVKKFLNDISIKEKKILFVGRLCELKGLSGIFDRLSKINLSEYSIDILGEGPLKESLVSKSVGFPVSFLGFKDPSEYFKKSSIFIFPSSVESYGIALAEAKAAGCACISFDCPVGPREILEHNKTGILVENGNYNDFIISLNKCISNDIFRHNLAKQAYLSNDHVSERIFLDKYLELFTTKK